MRIIACLIQRDGHHDVTERDDAVLAIVLDRLGLDDPPLPYWQH